MLRVLSRMPAGIEAFAGTLFLLSALLFSSAAPRGICSEEDKPGIDVVAIPVPLDPDQPERRDFDNLTLLAGFELRSRDPRFGGLSGLALSADRSILYAVSDRGRWFTARIHHDASGRLSSFSDWTTRPLLTPSGKIVSRTEEDAEALSRDRDGALLVAFEHDHRLWRYPCTLREGNPVPTPFPPPPDIAKAPDNGAMEALAALPDGRLLVLTEKYTDDRGNVKGWIFQEGRYTPIFLRPEGDFSPTDAAALLSGDVLVLERRFTLISGPGARIRRVEEKEIRPGAVLIGVEIFRIALPLSVDNFEGLAVHESGDGAAILYILSDDNFSAIQRTLLFQFRLDQGWGR